MSVILPERMTEPQNIIIYLFRKGMAKTTMPFLNIRENPGKMLPKAEHKSCILILIEVTELLERKKHYAG